VAGLGRKPRTSGRKCQRVKHYDTIRYCSCFQCLDCNCFSWKNVASCYA